MLLGNLAQVDPQKRMQGWGLGQIGQIGQIGNKSQRRSGGTLVEMAVIAIVCLSFMFAIFEYGRVVFTRQVMENAARAGARFAVVTPTSYLSPTTADANLQAAVESALAGQGQNLVNKKVEAYQADDAGNKIGPWTSTPFGRNMVVEVSGDLQLMFPTFGFVSANATTPNAVHLRIKCMMRGEAN